MLEKDIRNNSAWNHRWFVINGLKPEGMSIQDRIHEINYALDMAEKAPNNPSPYAYIRGYQITISLLII